MLSLQQLSHSNVPFPLLPQQLGTAMAPLLLWPSHPQHFAPDPFLGVAVHMAFAGLQLAADETQQGGLACKG